MITVMNPYMCFTTCSEFEKTCCQTQNLKTQRSWFSVKCRIIWLWLAVVMMACCYITGGSCSSAEREAAAGASRWRQQFGGQCNGHSTLGLVVAMHGTHCSAVRPAAAWCSCRKGGSHSASGSSHGQRRRGCGRTAFERSCVGSAGSGCYAAFVGCLRGGRCEDADDGAEGLDRSSWHVCSAEPGAFGTASEHCASVVFAE